MRWLLNQEAPAFRYGVRHGLTFALPVSSIWTEARESQKPISLRKERRAIGALFVYLMEHIEEHMEKLGEKEKRKLTKEFPFEKRFCGILNTRSCSSVG